MTRLAILDVETSSLDASTGQLLEVALADYDVASSSVVRSYASLVHATSNEAEAVNGIRVTTLALAHPREQVMKSVGAIASRCDFVLAWNADFDRAWLPELHGKPWIDGMDMPWPRSSTSRSLVAVALAHGIGIASAHRAMADVETVARLLTRASELGADVEAMVAHAALPRERFIADVPRSRNEELKAAGFRWDPDRKQWWKRATHDEARAFPFPVAACP